MLKLWHSILGMEKYDLKWHQRDLKDEMEEWEEAEGFINIWSEISDVVYTYTRGRWSGHTIKRPISIPKMWWGILYMIPKYTLRWSFFRIIGLKMKSKKPIREVRNPAKVHKLHGIAERYELDKIEFEKACKRLLRWWPLLK